jgi:hypothetical protein
LEHNVLRNAHAGRLISLIERSPRAIFGLSRALHGNALEFALFVVLVVHAHNFATHLSL